MALQDRIAELLAPAIAALGLDLVDIDYGGATLRVVVDRPLGSPEGGISTDQLAEVNRTCSPLLDEHDPIPGRYTLEVSSPGVERTLRHVDHFIRAIGEDVVVKMLPGIEPRRLKGRLESVADGAIVVVAREVDGADQPQALPHPVLIVDIDKARTVFEWGPGPKPGKSAKSAKPVPHSPKPIQPASEDSKEEAE